MSWQYAAGSGGDAALSAIKRYVGGRACYHQFPRMSQAGNQCELCPNRDSLQVHHKTYERYGQELLTDLVALCRECHARHHNVLPEEAA